MASGPPDNTGQEPPPPPPPRRAPKSGDEPSRPFSSIPWLLLLVAVSVALLFFWRRPETTGSRVGYSFFISQVESDNVAEVQFHGEILTGKWKSPPEDPEKSGETLKPDFNTVLPSDQVIDAEFLQLLGKHVPKIDAEPTSVGVGTQMLFWLIGPILLIGFFWFIMRRQVDPMGTGMMGNFIRSPAKRFRASDQRSTFDDVA